jgi:hypothetical protein
MRHITLSRIDAAAKVLGEKKAPMTTSDGNPR